MRRQLSKSDVLRLNERISAQFGRDGFFHKKDSLVLMDVDGRQVVFRDGPLFFYEGERLVPTLRLLLDDLILPVVVVDMGAVRFVTNGADVMRPGITSVDDGIDRGDFVVVVDETYGKPLAVCESLLCSEDLRAADSGKVLRNVHYVGDKLWNFQ